MGTRVEKPNTRKIRQGQYIFSSLVEADQEIEKKVQKKFWLALIMVLYGPPGIGKTVSARVIAEHAGYNVIEINARYSSYNYNILVICVHLRC